MPGLLKGIAEYVALGVECCAVLIVGYGAIEAVYGAIFAVARFPSHAGQRKKVWLRFGVWLLLGLEFTLAADIVRTAISPTWNDIGQLAAIGFIRTALNFFLEKDLERYQPRNPEASEVRQRPMAA